jgi:hypothetical protein
MREAWKGCPYPSRVLTSRCHVNGRLQKSKFQISAYIHTICYPRKGVHEWGYHDPDPACWCALRGKKCTRYHLENCSNRNQSLVSLTSDWWRKNQASSNLHNFVHIVFIPNLRIFMFVLSHIGECKAAGITVHTNISSNLDNHQPLYLCEISSSHGG